MAPEVWILLQTILNVITLSSIHVQLRKSEYHGMFDIPKTFTWRDANANIIKPGRLILADATSTNLYVEGPFT